MYKLTTLALVAAAMTGAIALLSASSTPADAQQRLKNYRIGTPYYNRAPNLNRTIKRRMQVGRTTFGRNAVRTPYGARHCSCRRTAYGVLCGGVRTPYGARSSRCRQTAYGLDCMGARPAPAPAPAATRSAASLSGATPSVPRSAPCTGPAGVPPTVSCAAGSRRPTAHAATAAARRLTACAASDIAHPAAGGSVVRRPSSADCHPCRNECDGEDPITTSPF